MLKCLLVGLGGFIGSLGRYLVGMLFFPLGLNFPLGTLSINFAGAFVIGAVTEFSYRMTPLPANLMLFLTVGICGGFTTFSTYSLETVNLLEEGRVLTGILYAAGSVLLCVAGVFVGKLLIRAFAHV